MSSAASVPLFFEILSSCKFEIFFKTLENFYNTSCLKIIDTEIYIFSIILLVKAAAMSSAASSLILLLEILNTSRVVLVSNVLAIIIIPVVCN